jgi:ankyrin repeat protein
LLVDLGFDVNARGTRTALQQAIAIGDLDLVRYLLDNGADPAAKDPLFQADAAGWAAWFKATDISDELSRRSR